MLSRFASYLGLIILSLAIPFILSRRKENASPFWPLKTAGIAFGDVCLVLIILVASSGGAGFGGAFKLAAFLLSYCVLLTGLYFLLCALGAPGVAAQAMVTLTAFLMMGTLFYADTLIDAVSAEARKAVLQWLINLNPLVTIGSQVFGDDFLRLPVVYRTTTIHYYPYSYPSLWTVILWYWAVGGVSFLAGWFIGKKNEFGKIS
ncbi:MAG: hypothetical protein HY811_03135 [Planctomycetes bacterium]|nr:hypothetical protein [Planctomycetota bacterium]